MTEAAKYFLCTLCVVWTLTQIIYLKYRAYWSRKDVDKWLAWDFVFVTAITITMIYTTR